MKFNCTGNTRSVAVCSQRNDISQLLTGEGEGNWLLAVTHDDICLFDYMMKNQSNSDGVTCRPAA